MKNYSEVYKIFSEMHREGGIGSSVFHDKIVELQNFLVKTKIEPKEVPILRALQREAVAKYNHMFKKCVHYKRIRFSDGLMAKIYRKLGMKISVKRKPKPKPKTDTISMTAMLNKKKSTKRNS